MYKKMSQWLNRRVEALAWELRLIVMRTDLATDREKIENLKKVS